MIAAVLHEASGTPRAESFPDPEVGADEVSVRVLAAGLHPLVRIHADGSHYSSHGIYPMIPGIDGVGELPDGSHAYVGWLRPPYGTFAEQAAVSKKSLLGLPKGLAPDLAAAIVNPAMSSWLALQLRARLAPGENVLVLGATGASGQLAVQVARALGAGRVVAAGRNTDVLGRLGADGALRVGSSEFRVGLERELSDHGVDIVLDYLWGEPAELTLEALLGAREHHGTRRVRYVDIGQSAGATIRFSPHVLRSTRIELLGSGIGSVTPAEIFAEVPRILDQVARGALEMEIDVHPLARVSEAWATPSAGGKRVVISP